MAATVSVSPPHRTAASSASCRCAAGSGPSGTGVLQATASAAWKAWTDRCKPEPVPLWVHTPKVPLNKKMDLRNVVFGLPKEALDKGKTYQARVLLHIDGADPHWFVWEFTTGQSARELKLK